MVGVVGASATGAAVGGADVVVPVDSGRFASVERGIAAPADPSTGTGVSNTSGSESTIGSDPSGWNAGATAPTACGAASIAPVTGVVIAAPVGCVMRNGTGRVVRRVEVVRRTARVMGTQRVRSTEYRTLRSATRTTRRTRTFFTTPCRPVTRQLAPTRGRMADSAEG